MSRTAYNRHYAVSLRYTQTLLRKASHNVERYVQLPRPFFEEKNKSRHPCRLKTTMTK